MNSIPNESNDVRGSATRHFLQWCLLPLFMVLLCVGCRQEATVAADIDPAGTYTLVSVDGNEVPATVEHDGRTLTVKSGIFIINADGTCSSEVGFSVASGDVANRVVKATYTREGSELTMRWEGAGVTQGTVEGDTFTMNNEGMIFAYRK